jgi:uncharacterized membrane protein YbaN (DUF454 family)
LITPGAFSSHLTPFLHTPGPLLTKRGAKLKTIIFMIGIISLVLGMIGTILPLLPTTPFLLLSAACFYRSSRRMHHWLLESRMGPYIQNYMEHRAIKRSAKYRALLMLWTTIGLSSHFAEDVRVSWFLFIVALGVTLHLYSLNEI